ncbi:hypothetical protein IV203_011527 [Nitzschia inconspicua]|uniref:Uncharacterized protein n=1 Tax=Nitzschia inconspicua TaxID=303405 RepID=A0A9K3KTH1_9STRA|nr:hypothetical protein IV203_011527 [Nitzschia inconspicua]
MAANESNSTAQNADGNISTEHSKIFSAIAFLKGKKKTELTHATFVSLNRNLAERGFCVSKSTPGPMQCHCLGVLSKKDYFCAAVANYQLKFFKQTWQSQQNTLVEWIRQSYKDPRDPRVWKFHIPFLLDETQPPYEFSDLRNATI